MNDHIAGATMHQEVTSGHSWYRASLEIELIRGDHLQRAKAAQRIVKRYCRMWNEPYPEEAELRDGKDAYDMLRMGMNAEEIVERLHYSSVNQALGHAEAFARNNGKRFPPASGKGQKSYDLRSSLKLPWKEVAGKVGLDTPESAIRAAKKYADEMGEPWPLVVPRVRRSTTGRDAYELRKQKLQWKEVGDQLGVHYDTAMQFAKRYAEEKHLPWPPFEVPDPEKVGAQAYKQREETFDLWGDIADRFGLKTEAVRRFAELWAQANDKPWPITAPQDFRRHCGQEAYEMRAETYASWPEIGEKLDRASDYVLKAAKDHAEKHDLPWPIEPPENFIPQPPRNTGQVAYDMRATERKDWHMLAKELGVSRAYAFRQAREYAQENNLEWPIQLPNTDNQTAYEARAAGLGWSDVAEQEGIAISTAQTRARRWAEEKGLPWPVEVAPVRTQHSERAERAYQMGYVDKIPWPKVAAELGYASHQSCTNSAKAYARRFKLPYPERKRKTAKRDGDRQKKAYEMRKADPNLSWTEISTILGYGTRRGGFTAARQYATSNNLPWPME